MLKAERDDKRLNTLIEINTLINSNYTDVKVLLNRILESATRLTDGQASSLILVNPENQKLYFEIALGSKGPDVKKLSLNKGEGIAGWVFEHNTSLIVNDVEEDPRFFSSIDKQVGFATSSILAVPMRIKDTCVGVIEIINKKDGKPFTDHDLKWLEVFATQSAIAIQNARSYQRVKDELYLLQDKIKSEQGFHTLVGSSPVIMEKLEITKRISGTNSSVLILGESGVGKELFAEQIHLHSNRKDQPLIRVNCAAIPENLLESELFGHVKGAFTDASANRRGRFELADEGTIFLDEIGDIPLSVQAKLLRVIQEKVFEKVGSSEPQKVDVRIIAATNKNLEKGIQEGTFRKDLYYRLNVLPLIIPPLRERYEDIPELSEFFLKRFKREVKKKILGFSEEALNSMMNYNWPGNVRELENAVERAVVISKNDYIQPEDLHLPEQDTNRLDLYKGKSLKEAITLFKKLFISKTLKEHGWKQTAVARKLNIQRTYLSRLIKELHITK